MNAPAIALILTMLGASCFSIATILQTRADNWTTRGQGGGILKMMFGEGRRLFANHFFIQADVYFHAGYYPSVFDQAAKQPSDSRHLTGASEADEHHEDEDHEAEHTGDEPGGDQHVHSEACHHDDAQARHYKEMAMNKPRDIIEKFGRKFVVTQHAHLSQGREREMLPWLRLSAEMDPQRIETYTVAAYWLGNLGKVNEAEAFLREGLRHNPESYEILFDLGRVMEKRKDNERARNLWLLALSHWRQQEQGKEKPDNVALESIAMRLAKVEQEMGNTAKAIEYLRMAEKVAPAPEQIRTRIAELSGGTVPPSNAER